MFWSIENTRVLHDYIIFGHLKLCWRFKLGLSGRASERENSANTCSSSPLYIRWPMNGLRECVRIKFITRLVYVRQFFLHHQMALKRSHSTTVISLKAMLRINYSSLVILQSFGQFGHWIFFLFNAKMLNWRYLEMRWYLIVCPLVFLNFCWFALFVFASGGEGDWISVGDILLGYFIPSLFDSSAVCNKVRHKRPWYCVGGYLIAFHHGPAFIGRIINMTVRKNRQTMKEFCKVLFRPKDHSTKPFLQ